MKLNLRILFVVFMLFCMSILCVTVNAESLPVKNAWIINNNENVLSLSNNGALFFGEDIYSQNKGLVLSNVKDVYVNSPRMIFVLLNSGEILKVDVQYISNQVEFENNIETIKGVKATALLKTYAGEDSVFFTNSNNELVLLDKYEKLSLICKNAKEVYVNREKITVLTTDNKIQLYKDEILITLLDNVTKISYEPINPYHEVIIGALTINNELYYLNIEDDECMPTRIATNVKSVLNAYRRHSNALNLPYIDKNDNLYFYNIDSNTTELVMKNAKDGFYLSPFYYIIGTDNNLYIDKTNTYSEKYNPTIVHRDIKEVLYSIEERFFLNSTSNELYMGYRPAGASPKLIISSTGLKNIKNVSAANCGNIGWHDYIFTSKVGCVYGTEYYGTETKKPVHTIYCQKPLKLIFNGKDIELKLKVQNVNNRTMYPFRECLENFGATVLWDAVNNCAIGKLNERTVEFPIGKQEYYVDGVKYEMDTTTYIDDSLGRTYIPLRYAAEGLGFKVDWIEKDTENIISIHK